jgi:rhomboid protease GluP
MVWVNAIVFVGELIYARDLMAVMRIPVSVAMAFGANYASATLYEGRIDTLVASCFVHYGILHIGFNMYALKQVGPFVERAVGTGRMAAMYMISGIIGSMASTLWGWFMSHEQVGAGASGAILGIIGAAMVIGLRTQGWKSPIIRALAPSLAMMAIIGFSGYVDNAAHVGGLLSGALVAGLWRRGEESGAGKRIAVSLAALVIALSGAVVFFHDLNDPYATLEASSRRDLAVSYLRAGKCAEARHALDAARRVAAADPGVKQTYRVFDQMCVPR